MAETLTFSLPATWTLGHWDLYIQARADYIRLHPTASGQAADFAGSMALIAAGVVHVVEVSEAVATYLAATDQTNTPLPIIGAVVIGVARSLEAATTAPLSTWTPPS